MNRVVTVNLNGNAYQLDEDGYALLHDYLESARARLGGNPDLEEIMADLEQAIADKVRRFLRPGKTVVSGDEIERVVDEMGPVDSPTEAHEAPDAGVAEPEPGRPAQPGARTLQPRKLYRLTGGEEKMVAGVCAGLAAYSGVDVSIVRIVFIALMFATSGILLLGYLLLIPVIPEAKTPEEQAAAYGVPFDARGVIDQAKSRFSSLGNGREWKRQSRIQRRWSRNARGAGSGISGSPLGLFVLFLGVILGVYVLIGLWSRPTLIGGPMMILQSPPWWWAAALLLLLGGVMLASIARGGQDRPPFLVSLLSTTVQVLLLLFVIWLAYRAFPFVRELVDGTMLAPHRAFH